LQWFTADHPEGWFWGWNPPFIPAMTFWVNSHVYISPQLLHVISTRRNAPHTKTKIRKSARLLLLIGSIDITKGAVFGGIDLPTVIT
jgi:hypothetical protein